MFMHLLLSVIVCALVCYLLGRLTNFQGTGFLRMLCAMELPLLTAAASGAVWWRMVSTNPWVLICFFVSAVAAGFGMGLARAHDPAWRA